MRAAFLILIDGTKECDVREQHDYDLRWHQVSASEPSTNQSDGHVSANANTRKLWSDPSTNGQDMYWPMKTRIKALRFSLK
jgi:hypothetical protein